jgi:iron complex outermembrane recepter protein
MKRAILLMAAFLPAVFVFGQNRLKGVVTDLQNKPLPGATVVILNTYYGTSTNPDGHFEFPNITTGPVELMVSFIGFESLKVRVSPGNTEKLVIRLSPSSHFTEEVLVQATRARDRMPVAFTNISGESLQLKNLGQDLPYMLTTTPSFVASSDAGTGIGYTSFRIRGTDMNRINVTVNGIPLNDAESHTTFFVDQPDLASSADNIQVQRGAGTSVNGAAAFGATINLQTLTLHAEPYGTVNTIAGSFGTFKNTVSAGTGLLNDRFTLDARLSDIRSNGFIDRAASHLKSFFISGGYYGENSVLKANVWSGWEETYQAWNGVPSVRLNNDRDGMLRYREHGLYSAAELENMLNSGNRTYNLYTYDNQVDHYQQDHYQVHYSQRFSPEWNGSVALHYTYGRGYYEEFKENIKFTDYGIQPPVVGNQEVKRTDLIRRKWLDNDFYGSVFSLQYRKGKVDAITGGGWNQYDGRHFGRLVWATYMQNLKKDYEWYRNSGIKKDVNGFFKVLYRLTPSLDYFADVQYRWIDYSIKGQDDDLRQLGLDRVYHFINPKSGFNFKVNPGQSVYLSWSLTNREPNRDNFVDTPQGGELPRHETLQDIEASWNYKSEKVAFVVNGYGMFYHDQLVLTGQINDVGAPVMVNVKKSHRVGVELQWGLKMLPHLNWDANLTLSSNRIQGFTEYVDDWDSGEQQAFDLGTTQLSFSPSVVSNSQLTWKKDLLGISLLTSLSGKQYIDNTASDDRILQPYMVNNLKLDYAVKTRFFKDLTLHLMVNNLLNAEYETNAWVYSYYFGGTRYKMDGYFPQAGRHFMAGLEIKL